MMVHDVEEHQLKGLIDLLAPYRHAQEPGGVSSPARWAFM
jgi:hypothetical protein